MPVVLLERGEPVERRGRAIGAMAVRGVLDPESNYCYGEGGAGTWSDGKLTTQIGRNSRPVREVLETLAAFGAPEVRPTSSARKQSWRARCLELSCWQRMPEAQC